MPSLEELDSKNNFSGTSLYRSAILYSHFRIIFNLSSVFISLFVYPGKFWDSFFQYKRAKNRFSNMFSRLYYIRDKSSFANAPALLSKSFPMHLQAATDENMDLHRHTDINI
jgi:hypothetical protein